MLYLHSKSLSFTHLTPNDIIAHGCITRIKAGKYTNKFRTDKTFCLIFKHLALID